MASHRFSALGVLLGSALSLTAAGCGGGIENGDYLLLRVAFSDLKEDASCYANDEIPKEIKNDTTSFRSGSTFVLYRGPEEAYYLDLEEVVMEGTREGDNFTFEGESVDVEYQGGIPAVVITDSDQDGIDDNDDPMVDADKDGQDDKFQDDYVDIDADGEDDRFEDQEVDVNGDGVDDRFTIVTPATDGDKYTSTRQQTVSFTITNENISGTVENVIKVKCSGVACPTKLPNCTQDLEFVGTVVKDADVEHQL